MMFDKFLITINSTKRDTHVKMREQFFVDIYAESPEIQIFSEDVRVAMAVGKCLEKLERHGFENVSKIEALSQVPERIVKLIPKSPAKSKNWTKFTWEPTPYLTVIRYDSSNCSIRNSYWEFLYYGKSALELMNIRGNSFNVGLESLFDGVHWHHIHTVVPHAVAHPEWPELNYRSNVATVLSEDEYRDLFMLVLLDE